MRWATFLQPSNPARQQVGRVVEDAIHTLDPSVTLLSLLGDDGETLATAGDNAMLDPHSVVSLADVMLLSPIPQPPTIRDFYAFEQHVKTARMRRALEMEPDWYELPVFYFSNPYAAIGSGADVPIFPGSSEFDYELEVAAIVGRRGSDLTPSQASQYIAGYCVMNDWSARDLQRREMKLNMGPVKGKDGATTLGPVMVTPDELEATRTGPSFDLTMTAIVNGKEYSRASLASIYWSFEEMLSYASRGSSIHEGDVIGSGTCGTGCILELSLSHGPEEYPWLHEGDVIELSVERLGTIRNIVTPAPPVHTLRPSKGIHV